MLKFKTVPRIFGILTDLAANGVPYFPHGGTMFRSVMLRFVLPVAFASCVVAYFGLPYIERLLAEWFRSDVELRSQLVMHSMEEPLTELLGKGNEGRLRAYLTKVTADERLLAILVCRPDGTMIFKTERAPSAITCGENAARNAM